MPKVASICTSCGLISITLRRPNQKVYCIKCDERIEIFYANSIDELWAIVSSDPPLPYTNKEDRGLLKVRFRKALERHEERQRNKQKDKELGSKWQYDAYLARKGLSAAKRARRRRRAR